MKRGIQDSREEGRWKEGVRIAGRRADEKRDSG